MDEFCIFNQIAVLPASEFSYGCAGAAIGQISPADVLIIRRDNDFRPVTEDPRVILKIPWVLNWYNLGLCAMIDIRTAFENVVAEQYSSAVGIGHETDAIGLFLLRDNPGENFTETAPVVVHDGKAVIIRQRLILFPAVVYEDASGGSVDRCGNLNELRKAVKMAEAHGDQGADPAEYGKPVT